MKPKVSIIVPIYNTEKYLKRCMDSVLNQTLKEIEVILVDDQSPDGAPELCDWYATQDNRVKVIHKKNGGLGFARNSGMEIATGEYVAYLDSDDYVERNMYECLYHYAKQHSADTVIAGFYMNEDDKRVSPYAGRFFDTPDSVRNVLFNLIGANRTAFRDNLLGMAVWAGIYSLDLIKKHNVQFCSERQFICEDAIFHIDYYQYAKAVYIAEECLYHYCDNGASLSKTFRKDRYDKDVILYYEEVRRLKEYGLLAEGKDYIDRMMLGFTRVYLHELSDNLSFKDAVPLMDRVLNHELLVALLKEYDYSHNPIKQRIFNTLMKLKLKLPIYMIFKLVK